MCYLQRHSSARFLNLELQVIEHTLFQRRGRNLMRGGEPGEVSTQRMNAVAQRSRPEAETMLLHAAGFLTERRLRTQEERGQVSKPTTFPGRTASCRAVGPAKLIIASLVLAFFGTRPLAITSCSVAVFLTSSARRLAACASLDSCPSSMGDIAAMRFWIRFCAGRAFCASLMNTSP